MANVYQPRLIQIRPQYSIETDAPDKPENILWFQSASAGVPTGSQLQAIAGIFDPDWSAAWGELGGDVAQYTGSVVTDWSSNTGLTYSSVGTFTPVVGTKGQLLPPQVAGLVSYQIGIRYKGGHPRSYIPYIGQSVVAGVYNDTISPSAITNWNTGLSNLWVAMLGSGILGGQSPACYRFRTEPARAVVNLINTATLNHIVATQRRRVRKVSHK